MALIASMFIDFWNFGKDWQEASKGKRLDWLRLATVLEKEASNVLKAECKIASVSLYAAIHDGDTKRQGLFTVLEKRGDFIVHKKRFKPPKCPHCARCRHDLAYCSICGQEVLRYQEEGADVHLATDMLVGGYQKKFEVAILCSADTDLLPAVSELRYKARRTLINVTWPHLGQRLAQCCGKWIMMQGAIIDNLVQK